MVVREQLTEQAGVDGMGCWDGDDREEEAVDRDEEGPDVDSYDHQHEHQCAAHPNVIPHLLFE